MNTLVKRELVPFLQFERMREGRTILRLEGEALLEISEKLDAEFCEAVDAILNCQQNVIVSGMGKAGIIGQKIAATLSSTGTPSHFLHPAEAVHGDLGCLHREDVLLMLSNSGETEEVCRLIPILQERISKLIAITAHEQSTLGREADVILPLGRLREAGANGLAPSTSTTAMLALGDALALVVKKARGLTAQQFAEFHPGGNLGKQLSNVEDVMRDRSQIRIALETATVREVFVSRSQPGRRSGAVILVDEDGILKGLFTDSDLARLLEKREDTRFDRPISDVMTVNPLTVTPQAILVEVVDLLSDKKISELPVVDPQGKPVGMVDITDIIGLLPHDPTE